MTTDNNTQELIQVQLQAELLKDYLRIKRELREEKAAKAKLLMEVDQLKSKLSKKGKRFSHKYNELRIKYDATQELLDEAKKDIELFINK